MNTRDSAKAFDALILLVSGRDTSQCTLSPHPGVSLCLWSGRAVDR